MYAVPYLEKLQAKLIGIPEERRLSPIFSMTLSQWATLGGVEPNADKIDAACGLVIPPFDTQTRKHLSNIRSALEAHIRWARKEQGVPHLSAHATGRDIERARLVKKALPAGLKKQASGSRVTTRRRAAKAGPQGVPQGQPTEPINFTDKGLSVEYQLLRRHSDELLVITRQTATRNTRGLPLALIVFSRLYTDWHLPLMEIDAGRDFRDILFTFLSWYRAPKHIDYVGEQRALDLELEAAFVPWDVDWSPRMWGKHDWPGRDLSGAVGEQDTVLAQQTRLRQYEKSIVQLAKQVVKMPAAQIAPLAPVPADARTDVTHRNRYVTERVSMALNALISVRISIPPHYHFN